MPKGPLVEVYARNDCSLCALSKGKGCAMCVDVAATVSKVSSEIPFQLRHVDISASDDLLRRYREDIPTVFINGKKAFKYKIDEGEFRKRIRKEIIKAGIMRAGGKKGHYS